MYGKLQATISASDLQIQSQQLKTVRKINKYKIPDFLTNLSYKTWGIAVCKHNVQFLLKYIFKDLSSVQHYYVLLKDIKEAKKWIIIAEY